MILRKKTIIVLTLVLLIVAAGYVSTKYGKVIKVDNNKDKSAAQTKNTEATTAVNKASTGYFVDVKIGRENQRTVDKQTLKEMIDNQNTSKEAKKKAEDQYINLGNISEKEMIMEALIKSKGFDDAVVLLSSDSANITVKVKEIKADQVVQIKNIVCKESGLPATKVMVQSKE